MNLFDVVEPLVARYLDRRNPIPQIIDEIKTRAGDGKIAFYPCGRYGNRIALEIKQADPELYSRIVGFFDESATATSAAGVPVHPIDELEELRERVSLLLVASTAFSSRELGRLKEISGYTGETLAVSQFDYSLPLGDKERILVDFKHVYDLLADRKSRTVYLLTWLSRAINDEDITYIFEGEDRETLDGQNTKYKNFVLRGLGDSIARELQADLYAMRSVHPTAGDIVLDIGAYKGDTAILFADAVGPNGKVYAFEPTGASYDGLVENVNANRLNETVFPIRKGMGGRSGAMKATVMSNGVPWSYVQSDEGTEGVEITTIDDFVKSENLASVDYVKMDVQGLELDVLVGGKRSIRHFKPRMAVTMSNKTSHLLELPLFVDELGGYELFMRSKMEGPFGITLFCRSKS